ncbi:MAG: DHH family phosphoesterase [Bacilli bacterium]|nr:DHH family phosphoesterase [Bacilli bacterium]
MEKIIILGHENLDVDSIVSGYLLEKILLKRGYNAEFIIPDKFIEEETLSICLRNGLNPNKFVKDLNFENEENKYILVDHHERDLTGEIVCIIDHHPTSKEISVKHYYNKKVSSTAAYISIGNENLLEEFDLKLAVLATLVDTASFHSTKSRVEDELWVKDICDKYNINYNELYKEGLGLTSL